jgi:signal peptide peptidase SppA
MDFRRSLFNRPWAIRPEAFSGIAAGLPPMAALRRRAAFGDATTSSRIAVLPLLGTISRRGSFWDFPGDTSLEQFAAVFKQVLGDPSIDAIVIEVDSPGGTVYGVDELAAQIFAARARKRIAAIANAEASSAAYWIGSAAGELSVAPSGQVGSIGIVAMHLDESRAEDLAGVNVTMISAGKYKTEANEHEPLGDTARAALQGRVFQYHRMFVRAVARNRGVSFADVHDGFGEGRVVGAEDALKLGMVDRIETMDDLLTRLASTPASPRAPRAAAASDYGINEARAARARLRDALKRAPGGNSTNG